MSFVMGREEIEAELKGLQDYLSEAKKQSDGWFEGRDLKRVLSYSTELKFITKDRWDQFRLRVDSLISRLERALGELRNREERRLKLEEGLELVATVGALEAEFDELRALLELAKVSLETAPREPKVDIAALRAAVARALGFLTSVLGTAVHKVASWLWNIITAMLTPKEWSIGGEVGTAALGLAKVKVEVKFGPQIPASGSGVRR